MTTGALTERDDAVRRVRHSLVQVLESLESSGVTHLPKVQTTLQGPEAEQEPPPKVLEPVVAVQNPPSQPEHGMEQGSFASQAKLDVLRQEVAACTRCAELAQTRKQTVFGVGNPKARLCFLGEAPGAEEDRQGEPFVGRAGQLLTKIIEACTLSRQEVYILNVLKCRPPENRNPLPDEVSNCREFLDRQLEIIQPEFLCCLGGVAASTLLETKLSIGKLRGRFLDYHGIRVMCTYHPAYLLRNPSAKKLVWEDMQTLMAEMGIELPHR